MADLESLYKDIVSLNIRDLHSLVTRLKEEFNITAPVFSAGVAPAGSGAQAAAEEEKQYHVKITGFEADKKINFIRYIREAKGLSLKDAMDFVQGSLPCNADDQKYPKDKAEELLKKIIAAGGQAELV